MAKSTDLHGEATSARLVVFGCKEGILVACPRRIDRPKLRKRSSPFDLLKKSKNPDVLPRLGNVEASSSTRTAKEHFRLSTFPSGASSFSLGPVTRNPYVPPSVRNTSPVPDQDPFHKEMTMQDAFVDYLRLTKNLGLVLSVRQSSYQPVSAYIFLDRVRYDSLTAPLEVYRAIDKLRFNVLSGFPGASKMTRLNQIIANREGMRVAIISNWSNGSICCTLHDELLNEVRVLAKEGQFAYLLFESTGFAEPLRVAAIFDLRDEHGQSLSEVSHYDTVVSVVDTANFFKYYSSPDFLTDRGETVGDDNTRDAARETIFSLNPMTKLFEMDFGIASLKEVPRAVRLDFAKAEISQLWFKVLHSFRGRGIPHPLIS
ncbi:hypothetical protein CONLIGDRAFT_685928 [Coniochaeta ligniaria NRRL 30616]|uniref:CobW/HypB/UreG nucleotide-binding domain-containing protein n=1 Tax=Coniochaeta ligniaria NRRL 30616 TaxID=1408157 RepID=A0A1J7IA30_9PEZI|nr:hypothetical protein CONLIGDRAFT_685928 [Coniochaeta ligniaria NRRL 30616]